MAKLNCGIELEFYELLLCCNFIKYKKKVCGLTKMSVDDLTYKLFEDFSQDNFCLLYDGNIADELTGRIINLSEHYLQSEVDFAKSKNKVSFLLAECFQNIIRHTGIIKSTEGSNIDSGFFFIRNIKGIYLITSGNLIKSENVPDLQRRLEKVNSLDQESLKSLYRDVLANKGFTEKGGAGLGLIEIARKSGQKIEFVFDGFNANYSIFYNQVMFMPKEQTPDNDFSSKEYIHKAIQYHKMMLNENIMMIQKGDFSHGSILPVLEILGKNLNEIFHHNHPRNEAFHILVELLQIIDKLAIEENGRRQGIFIIRKNKDALLISAGNYIENNLAKSVSSELDQLNRLSKVELKQRYMKALDDEHEDFKIELIEIARRSLKPIQYQLIESNKNKIFYAVSVDI